MGLVTTTHESLVVEPWPVSTTDPPDAPHGVRVAQADDAEQPIMLYRDAGEVVAFCSELMRAAGVDRIELGHG